MTSYDAAMAIVVVLGMIRGAWRGFTWQVASIASLLLGYTAAHSGSARLASYLPGEPEVQRVLAMALLYVAVSGGIFALAWMVRGTLRKLRFEAYDRHLGTLLGGIEGLGVGLLATMFLVSLAPAIRQPVFSSPTGRVVGMVMNNLGPVLPAEVRKVLAPHWDSGESAPLTVADGSPVQGLSPRGDSELQSTEASAPTSLPAVDENVAADLAGPPAALPSLPAIEETPRTDLAVQHTGSSRSRKQKGHDRASNRSVGAGQRIEHAIEDAISTGKDEVVKSIEDTIDDQVRTLGGLESAPTKGPK